MNIKFKAKAKSNGEWVEGDLLQSHKRAYICSGQVKPCCKYGRDWVEAYDTVEVVPETVGQWLGIEDKNGKEVFTGDIAIINEIKWIIEWDEYQGRFYVTPLQGGQSVFQHIRAAGFLCVDCETDSTLRGEIEVVGNIHDTESK